MRLEIFLMAHNSLLDALINVLVYSKVFVNSLWNTIWNASRKKVVRSSGTLWDAKCPQSYQFCPGRVTNRAHQTGRQFDSRLRN